MPLLVHLINMLRHRRQRWAAMDFLLASYRKQKKWIRLRQLLLLLSRLAVAAVLIALLCGWTGGGQILGSIGGSPGLCWGRAEGNLPTNQESEW